MTAKHSHNHHMDRGMGLFICVYSLGQWARVVVFLFASKDGVGTGPGKSTLVLSPSAHYSAPTPLSEFPAFLADIPAITAVLKSLDLSGNAITFLPEGQLRPFSRLKTLNLTANSLGSAKSVSSPWVDLPTSLVSLNLSHNQLTSLPNISQCVALQHLIVDGNRLTSLEGVQDLTNLQSLSAAGNNLTSLPTDLHKLHVLSHLVLSRNSLQFLPFSILALVSTRVMLDSNFFDNVGSLAANLNTTAASIQKAITDEESLDELELKARRVTSSSSKRWSRTRASSKPHPSQDKPWFSVTSAASDYDIMSDALSSSPANTVGVSGWALFGSSSFPSLRELAASVVIEAFPNVFSPSSRALPSDLVSYLNGRQYTCATCDTQSFTPFIDVVAPLMLLVRAARASKPGSSNHVSGAMARFEALAPTPIHPFYLRRIPFLASLCRSCLFSLAICYPSSPSTKRILR